MVTKTDMQKFIVELIQEYADYQPELDINKVAAEIEKRIGQQIQIQFNEWANNLIADYYFLESESYNHFVGKGISRSDVLHEKIYLLQNVKEVMVRILAKNII